MVKQLRGNSSRPRQGSSRVLNVSESKNGNGKVLLALIKVRGAYSRRSGRGLI